MKRSKSKKDQLKTISDSNNTISKRFLILNSNLEVFCSFSVISEKEIRTMLSRTALSLLLERNQRPQYIPFGCPSLG
jgi:hypothetical protein